MRPICDIFSCSINKDIKNMVYILCGNKKSMAAYFKNGGGGKRWKLALQAATKEDYSWAVYINLR